MVYEEQTLHTDEKSRDICCKLYPGINAEVFYLDLGVAAMVKYADNCFHASHFDKRALGVQPVTQSP